MKIQSSQSDAASAFLAKHQDSITGILHGFDRVRIRGTLRSLYHGPMMETYLRVAGVMWKDFKDYVVGLSHRIKANSVGQAERLARPYIYLPSSNVSKE